MRRVVAIAVIAAGATFATGAQTLAAGEAPIGGAAWVVTMGKKLNDRLGANCVFVQPNGWAVVTSAKYGFLLGDGPNGQYASGSYDAASHRGKVMEKGGALLFDSQFTKFGSGGHPVKIGKIGIEVSGSRAFVTGVVSKAKTNASATRRSRLMQI